MTTPDRPPTIGWHTGDRATLRPLFELAEDSPTELDGYLDGGRVLLACEGGETAGPRHAGHPLARGVPPGRVRERRRGVQSALLATRLADAVGTGCDVAVITTQPGSRSEQNADRQGFDLLYIRAVLVQEAAGAGASGTAPRAPRS